MSRIPLLLVPGLLCTARMWEPQVAALSGDCEITVGEQRLDDSIAAMARRILAGAPDRFALAGLSMGGYVAMEIWRQAPERVQRLALLDTRMTLDSPEEAARRRDLLKQVEVGRFRGIHERLLPLIVHPDRLGDADLVGVIADMAEQTGRDGFVNQQRAILGRTDSRPTGPTITVPTLVLCGRQDVLTPLDLHREMADLIPGARLAVIEDCGHLSTLERPQAVNRELGAWLGLQPLPPRRLHR